MRFGLYQPFNLTVRVALWVFWMAIALSVIAIGSRSPEPNHPAGLLLLGLGLFGPGLLSFLTLRSSSLWERLIDLGEEQDLQEARKRVKGLAVLGLAGLLMLGWALARLF
ncbi:MAG: hypothetical protein ABUT39_28140 [Acidobacteriota bacterium]